MRVGDVNKNVHSLLTLLICVQWSKYIKIRTTIIEDLAVGAVVYWISVHSIATCEEDLTPAEESCKLVADRSSVIIYYLVASIKVVTFIFFLQSASSERRKNGHLPERPDREPNVAPGLPQEQPQNVGQQMPIAVPVPVQQPQYDNQLPQLHGAHQYPPPNLPNVQHQPVNPYPQQPPAYPQQAPYPHPAPYPPHAQGLYPEPANHHYPQPYAPVYPNAYPQGGPSPGNYSGYSI